MSENHMIFCENLVKIYKTDEIEVQALQGLDLIVEKGELISIIGNSGSGKSTLLNMVGALDVPTAGTLLVDGKNLSKFSKEDIVEYKRSTVGFVWQNNARNLIPYLSVKENVEMPMVLKGSVDSDYALELIDMVGLSHRTHHKLHELSGGEQQRCAIALALANKPSLLLADEPTGAIDNYNTIKVLEMLKVLNERLKVTIVIVTHDRQVAKHVNRVVAIRDGRTSAEFIKRSEVELILKGAKSIGDELTKTGSHEEYAILDKTGRLQIPEEYLKNLGLTGRNKVKVTVEDDSIIIKNPKE